MQKNPNDSLQKGRCSGVIYDQSMARREKTTLHTGSAACVGACTVVLCLTGCADPDSAIGFDQPAPAARFRAIHQAAVIDEQSAIPDLIQMLDSDDPAERVLASGTLERLTGQSFGYDGSLPRPERDAAVQRWVEWYSQKGKSASPGSGGATPIPHENGT